MRLRRIEAVSYGGLDCVEVGECGDGLSVVLGPNESGKTTLTALVRHVLYGFPKQSAREPSFVPTAGRRHARLVFAGGEGRWVVERTEGSHRGPVTVRTVDGPDRPELLADLTQGVSESTFRIVFGFGLNELAEIEQRSGDDIIGRLYAAGAGLGVSPLDIRSQVDERAGKLYSPGGKNPVVNARVREHKEARALVRALEDQATAFASDQQRLHELDARLVPLAAALEETDSRSRTIALELERLRAWHGEAVGLERSLAEQRKERAALQRRIEAIVPDQRVLEAAVELDAHLGELPVFSERLGQLREQESELAALASRIADEYRELPEEATATPELTAAIDTWRDRLSRIEVREETARLAAQRADSAAERAKESLAATGARPAPTAPVAGWVMLVLGVAAIAVGVVTSSTPTWAIGVLTAAAGLLFVLRPNAFGGTSAGTARARSGEEAERLRVAAAEATDEASNAAADLTAARDEWASWRAAHGLPDTVEDPSAARLLADRLLERERLRQERDRMAAETDRLRDDLEDWAQRFAAAASPAVDLAGPLPLNDVVIAAARVRAAVDEAREAHSQRADLGREATDARAAIEAAEARLAELRAHVSETAVRHELTEQDPVVALEARAEQIGRELTQVREEHDTVSRERHELAGKLGSEGREAAMAEGRQRAETLRAQAEEAAGEYLTLALASALLNRAQAHYERDRQPEVTRRAGAVFSTMTRGRYTGVQVPLGGGEIVVVSEGDRVRRTAELSRGTAEQLYLALRIGLVEQLGTVGAGLPVLMDDVVVNFDAERREGAAQAIADLAQRRQVVFFTCHESTADLLLSVAPGCTQLTLDRCSL